MEQREGNTYTFRVVFHEGPQSAHMTIKQEAYNLIIGKYKLSLRNISSNEMILEWPYDCIRGYGVSPNTFSVDSGRRSWTGQGIFVMETTKGKEIRDKIRKMAKQIADERNPRTKKAQTGNLNTEHWPHTRKDETLGKGISELESKLCHLPGRKTTTSRPETAGGPATANIGLGSEFTIRTRSEPAATPGSEHPSRSDTGDYLLPTFTDTVYIDEYVYDDGEVLTTPVISDVLDESKCWKPTRTGYENVSLKNSTEHVRGQDSAIQIPSRVVLLDSPKKERSTMPRTDYENVKFFRK